MIRIAAVLVAFLTAVTASAQRPLFDPDDFLDPRSTGGRPVLISRLVVGAGSNLTGDGFRPLGKNTGYVHLATSFSWRSVQFDYKRSQIQDQDGNAARWELPRENDGENGGGEFTPFKRARNATPKSDGGVILVPSPPPPLQQTRNATPKSKDTLNAAFYWPVPAGGGIPVMLRSRVTFSTQPIETDLIAFNQPTRHLSGRERTFALDTDTWFRIAGHDVYGSLAFSQTRTKTQTPDIDDFETPGDRDERAITYTNRFPSLSLDKAKIVIRPTLTVGGISNRGGAALNVVSPAIEIFRPFPRTGANLHVIYSPQWAVEPIVGSQTNPGGAQWRTTHQVAVLIDRALFVKVF
jgi:hypothetical protein